MTENNRITYAILFPTCLNIDLVKDVGMVPFILHRDFGYNSYIICYKNGDYPYLKTEVSGLKLLFMKRSRYKFFLKRIIEILGKKRPIITKMLKLFCKISGVIHILVRYGKQIDVLHLQHLKLESIIAGLLYKLLNKNGILYLKLDANPDDFFSLSKDSSEKLSSKTLLKYSLLVLLRLISVISFDIISVESRKLYGFIRTNPSLIKNCRDHIKYIPNGIDLNRLSPLIKNLNEKKNIILHVGRIGTYQKGSEIILEAFAQVAKDFSSWKLVLIGPMDNNFTDYFEDFLEKNKMIRDRIDYLGFVPSRKQLYEHYNEAKILAFPSRFESFGIVAVEAGAFGDVILGADIPTVREITYNGNFGYLCPIDDVECFTETLRYMLSHEDELIKKSKSITKFVRDNFNWNGICGRLHEIILK